MKILKKIFKIYVILVYLYIFRNFYEIQTKRIKIILKNDAKIKQKKFLCSRQFKNYIHMKRKAKSLKSNSYTSFILPTFNSLNIDNVMP